MSIMIGSSPSSDTHPSNRRAAGSLLPILNGTPRQTSMIVLQLGHSLCGSEVGSAGSSEWVFMCSSNSESSNHRPQVLH
jgi:hypothetical protein